MATNDDCFRIGDLSIFFVSFDEPWATRFFDDLVAKAPHAERVHGVVGHDNAIKECAARSRTRRFLLVDADNLLRPEILDLVVNDAGGKDAVLSFRGYNTVNGLEYGNGGPACWPRHTALSMLTHDAAVSPEASVDFCWTIPTFMLDAVGSQIHIAQTPYHAFRAGYREAVKMSLVGGVQKGSLAETKALAAKCNWSRLLMWASVGSDVPNGQWAILGVRKALQDIWIDGLPITRINDYGWFDTYWRQVAGADPAAAGAEIAAILNQRFGLGIQELEPQLSQWVKEAYVNPTGSGFIRPADSPRGAPGPRIVGRAPMPVTSALPAQVASESTWTGKALHTLIDPVCDALAHGPRTVRNSAAVELETLPAPASGGG